MGWLNICYELIDDPMIKSCGCDGLIDAFYALKGLYHMFELNVDLDDEFILEVINASIDSRNRYCSLNGAEELPHVTIVEGEFILVNKTEDLSL